MNRRNFLATTAVCLLGLISLKASAATANPKRCPVCAGKLVKAKTMKYSKESTYTNFVLWLPDNSIHGDYNYGYSPDGEICSVCFLAYIERVDEWQRSTIRLKSFHTPLHSSIAGFPLPPNQEPLYSQAFYGKEADKGQIETLNVWAKLDNGYKEILKKYSNENEIQLELNTPERRPDMLHITATKIVKPDTTGKFRLPPTEEDT